MFVFETVPSSPTRLLLSVFFHLSAIALALTLRFAAPTAPVIARPVPITLEAPPRFAPPLRPLPHVPAPSISLPRTRAFSAPPTTARRLRPLKIEAVLVTPEPTFSISVEPRISATLAPPPVIVGRLATATAAISDAEVRTLRPTTFATSAPAESAPTKTARLGAFGEASFATPATTHKSPQAPTTTTSVEILSKPRPLYTDEARRLRIEGEVLLEVLFTATGIAQVQHILRGLGHGLDESAAASATQIQFRPAQRAGQPVDQTATVHITFQLAY